jgi:hypothetical protein
MTTGTRRPVLSAARAAAVTAAAVSADAVDGDRTRFVGGF